MPDSRKAPTRYADLSLVQLKTFADRGDVRAKHELDLRMGGAPRYASTRPPQLAPLPSVEASPLMTPEQRANARTKPQPLKHGQKPTEPASLSEHAETGFSQGLPGMPPLPPAAQALAAGAGMGATGLAGSGLKESMLFEHLPPGQTLSPDLLNRLSDIARKAPEPEVQPPLILGSCMMFVGLILLLFGFSVTRGDSGTWFFVATGALLLLSGLLYVKGKRPAVVVYGLTILIVLGWALYESPSWLEAVLRVLPLGPLSIFAFTLNTRDRLGLDD